MELRVEMEVDIVRGGLLRMCGDIEGWERDENELDEVTG